MFSLRDETEACPNLTADIQVIDELPFFVRPFPLSETDKEFMDEQMERLVSLGNTVQEQHKPHITSDVNNQKTDKLQNTSGRFQVVEHENLEKKYIDTTDERCIEYFS